MFLTIDMYLITIDAVFLGVYTGIDHVENSLLLKYLALFYRLVCLKERPWPVSCIYFFVETHKKIACSEIR